MPATVSALGSPTLQLSPKSTNLTYPLLSMSMFSGLRLDEMRVTPYRCSFGGGLCRERVLFVRCRIWHWIGGCLRLFVESFESADESE